MSLQRDLRAFFARFGVLVGDGGMGTMLQGGGLPAGACPELWNASRPDVVESIHRAYVAAGAHLIETNTFGGSPRKLRAYGLEARCAELNRSGAELCRRAAGDAALVVGSIGPTGELLQPFGDLSEDEACGGFHLQAQSLLRGGADALCVETMIDLREALLAVRAATQTGLPVMASLTYEPTPRGFFTIMGADIPSSAAALAQAGAAVVGTNCGVGPDTMVEMVRALRACTDLPILVQPNAGLPVVRAGEVVYPQGPGDMAAFVPAFVAAGASIIGGCCGTTPDHVRAVAAALRSRSRQ